MQQLRFIFIAFLTSLSVTNATLLRKTLAVLLFSILSFDSIGFYGFVNQGGKADAVTPKGNTKGQAAASQSNDSIAGKWSSDWGPVEFNSNLTGQWNQGVGIGQIKDGTYDPKTRKLVFHYYQPWNDMDGTVTLTLSEDGGQLSGVWTQQRGSSPIGSGGSGGWTMQRAAREVSQFALTRATTTDAKSVDVIYKTTDTNIQNQSIHFDVYRSPTKDTAPASHQIEISKQEEIQDETNSDPHLHGVKLTFKNEDALKPNTDFPYVVVVATYNGKQSITYFRKWLLGAISHGFNRYNQAGVIGFGFRAYYHYEAGLDDDPGRIPDWETNMAQNLKAYDKYDDVISFDWTKTCALVQPDMAVNAGRDLSKQILDWVIAHLSHEGDVVDIHLIGHSRGTVVVTQALNDLVKYFPDVDLGGSYIELTLLDPHPASDKFGQWADFGTNGKGKETDIAIAADLYTDHFQEIANDPPLMLPKGIKKIDIWYQQTRANDLVGDPDGADTMNLWGFYKVGEGQAIRNNSGLTIKPIPIPNTAHNQIPNVYERQVVETGMLNRSN